MKNKILLSFENEVSEGDYKERVELVETFSRLPIEFFSKMRHLQPQIGCLNCCKICSKFASENMCYWNINRLHNVIASLKYVVINKYRKEKPYLAWDRKEHRVGVIFCYLDNDISNYEYLEEYIKLLYSELGVVTRISTVGYSRFNKKLNEMHKSISKLYNELGGVRLSFTPYEIGWENSDVHFSRYDYAADMTNFLKIYKEYYNDVGSGSRKFCVEIRYKPLVQKCEVYTFKINGHFVINCNNYLFISKDINISMNEAHIKNAYNHSIELTEEPTKFYSFDLFDKTRNELDARKIAFKWIEKGISNEKEVDCYLFKNSDGIYYAFEPSIKENGNYGMNIYPKTNYRTQSGYIITERFLLNKLIEYKAGKNIKRREKFENANWEDVYNVLKLLQKTAEEYSEIGKLEKSQYIKNEILPMINAYVFALQEAKYPASCFFDKDFTIDTGIICNLGRAISEFGNLTSKANEPLTPTHERNYGVTNSTMVVENISWRLSAGFKNTLIIEKLNMARTAGEEGQIDTKIIIKLDEKNKDIVYKFNDLYTNYLLLGQRLKDDNILL